MVEKEVDHLPGVRENRQRAEERGGGRGPAEGVEAREEPPGAEGLPAEAGGGLPALGPPGDVCVDAGFGVPVDELRDVLESLDELVDAVALREEDDELVDCVGTVAHGGGGGGRRELVG